MNQLEHQLNNTLAAVEKGFNIVGYIPVASTYSGGLRMVCGKLEIIGAIAASALFAIVALFSPTDHERHEGIKKAAKILKTYTLHGVANIFRGAMEATALLGLVACLPYDLFCNRFAYPHEKPGFFPLRNLYQSSKITCI